MMFKFNVFNPLIYHHCRKCIQWWLMVVKMVVDGDWIADQRRMEWRLMVVDCGCWWLAPVITRWPEWCLLVVKGAVVVLVIKGG
jgi:hypothetical protein